jgi:pimeloyl-ACP methyl ester carboxylesterase
MPTLDVNGININSEQAGEDGAWLIIVHGLLGSIGNTRPHERPSAFAAKGLRALAYDARGHGESGYTLDRADYTFSALAEDLYTIIHTLGIDRASIYGSSMGAGTALALALAHPESVEKLILRGPTGTGDALKPAQRLFGGMSLLYQAFGSRLAARAIMATAAAKEQQAAYPGRDIRLFYARQRRAAIIPAIRGVLFDEEIALDRAAEVQHPTLILAHDDDPVHPLATAEALHDRMPHAKLAVAPSATYWDDNPDALTHVISAFVKDETIARGLPEKAHRHE